MSTTQQVAVDQKVTAGIFTTLVAAAEKGDFAAIEKILYPALDKNDRLPLQVLMHYQDMNGRTVLHFACQSSPKANNSDHTNDVVCQLMQILSPPLMPRLLSVKDKKGFTPIMLAAQHSNRVLAERRVCSLLDAADFVNTNIYAHTGQLKCKLGLARSNVGATALHYAASAAATRTCILQLFEGGKAALQTFSKQGGTPLHWACAAVVTNDVRKYKERMEAMLCFMETTRALLDCGADMQAMSDTVPPPVYVALEAEHEDIASIILLQQSSFGKDWSPTLEYISSPGGLSVFHLAAEMDMVDVLRILLKRVDQNINYDRLVSAIQRANDNNLTPLQIARRRKNVETVQLLLPYAQQYESRNDSNATNNTSHPLSIATQEAAFAYIKDGIVPKMVNVNNVPISEVNNTIDDTTVDSAIEDRPFAVIESRAQNHVNGIGLQLEMTCNVLTSTYDSASQAKKNGNDLFASNCFQDAIKYYQTGITQIEQDLFAPRRDSCSAMTLDTEYADANDVCVLLGTLHSNKSACFVIMYQHHREQQDSQQDSNVQTHNDANDNSFLENALYEALVARHLRPDWAKAAYRVAVAQLKLKQYFDASCSAWNGLLIEENNAELTQLYHQCFNEGRGKFHLPENRHLNN